MPIANKNIWENHQPASWLPNWLHQDEYPDVENADKRLFAWEFLRRNPEYQNDYAKIKEFSDAESVQKYYLSPDGYNIFNPIYKNGQIPSLRFHAELYTKLAKWGLSYNLLNPEYNFRETVDFDFATRMGQYNWCKKAVRVEDSGEYIPVDGGIIPSKNEVAYLFDLSLPITPQIDNLKTYLEKSQKELLGKKVQASKTSLIDFPRYLRILDADAKKTEDTKIAEELYPDKASFTYFNKKEELYPNDHHRNPRADDLRGDRNSAYQLLSGGYKLLF